MGKQTKVNGDSSEFYLMTPKNSTTRRVIYITTEYNGNIYRGTIWQHFCSWSEAESDALNFVESRDATVNFTKLKEIIAPWRVLVVGIGASEYMESMGFDLVDEDKYYNVFKCDLKSR